MLIRFLFQALFAILKLLIMLFPQLGGEVIVGVFDFSLLIKRASYFFPGDLFVCLIGCFVLVTSAHIVWAVVEWIYKKIPGVS